MPDIVLTRIDNRLIHGQVATQWCGVVGANLLLVANDAVSTDDISYLPDSDGNPALVSGAYIQVQNQVA